jgi:hypothetical protein
MQELLSKIVTLSYTGDVRMGIAEDPQKVIHCSDEAIFSACMVHVQKQGVLISQSRACCRDFFMIIELILLMELTAHRKIGLFSFARLCCVNASHC